MARYPALIHTFDRLNENYSIYLDDLDRKGEQKIITLWEKEFNLKFEILHGCLAACISGDAYNPKIL